LELFEKIHFKSSNFQLISTLEPNLTMKFVEFFDKFLIIKSGAHKVSKEISCIKIHPRRPELFWILCQKTCEIDWNSHSFLYVWILVNLTGFLTESKISQVFVDGFWRKIVFWKRYEFHFLWSKICHKIPRISSRNLALKWRLAENWKT
jgi:hypothetical protein